MLIETWGTAWDSFVHRVNKVTCDFSGAMIRFFVFDHSDTAFTLSFNFVLKTFSWVVLLSAVVVLVVRLGPGTTWGRTSLGPGFLSGRELYDDGPRLSRENGYPELGVLGSLEKRLLKEVGKVAGRQKQKKSKITFFSVCTTVHTSVHSPSPPPRMDRWTVGQTDRMVLHMTN